MDKYGVNSIETTVKRMAKPLRKFERKSLILVPIRLSDEKHWIMAAVYLQERRIVMYDSIIHSERKGVGRKLVEVFEKACLFDLSPVQHQVIVVQDRNVPAQHNNHDCGVFIIQYAKHILVNRKMRFNEEDMPRLRREAIEELVTGIPLPLPEETFEEILEDLKMVCETKDKEEDMDLELSVNETPEKNESVRSSNPHYQPSPNTLQELRKGEEPFVDIDNNGKEFTQNMAGDWRRSLKLTEILSILHPVKTEAWKLLFQELKIQPSIGLHWFEISTKPLQRPTPQQFRFGYFRYAKKVKAFYESQFPSTLKIIGTHQGLKHRGGRRVRQAKGDR